MEWFIILIIIVAVTGPIISVLFWYFLIKSAVNHVQAFEEEQAELKKLVKRYSNKTYQGQIPLVISNRVVSKLMSMKNHFNQMDHIRQQSYDTKMSGMIGDVTSAGFTNFDPGSLY